MRASDHPYFVPTPLALAHRGGSLYGPNEGLENTLVAFRRAVELGYVHLETDVHLTSDGVLVAAHDEKLDRVSDATGAIADLTFAELRRARIGGREPVPTMAELFEALPAAKFNIDLKAPGTAEPLLDLIDRYGAHDRVCVGSFTDRHLWEFRRLAKGRVATSGGRIGSAAMRLLPWPLARRFATPGLAFQVPTHYDIGPVRVDVVTPEFVRRAHELGKQVHVWTIDERAEMVRLLDLGVDGIVTDALEVLADLYRERGLHVPPVAG